MRIYLAARFGRRDELRRYRDELVRRGHEVTSRWLDEEDESDRQLFAQYAFDDWQDIKAAQCMINFTEPTRTGPTRGGRHVELGIALESGMPVIVVGDTENVFHHLLWIKVVSSFGKALPLIDQLATQGWMR